MKRRGPMPCDAVWASIRLLRRFTLGEVVRDADVPRSTAWTYLKALIEGGYVKATGRRVARRRVLGGGIVKTHRMEVVHELVRDVGVEAPRFGETGRGRDQMWRAMKMIGDFTCRELAFSASTERVKVTLAGARLYVHYLAKAGYLAAPKRDGNAVVYRLAKPTGGKAPAIERDAPGGRRVFDPNLGKVVWPEAPQ